MRASEILRGLADMLDARETQSSSTEINNRPNTQEVPTEIPSDTAGIEGEAQVNVKTMVPPLQQKIDLMKKLAGLEHSEVGGLDTDEQEAQFSGNCGCEEPDELAIMKQNAGITPLVMAIADEDEPYEG
ncbi:MAG TPA: hypothetical protein VFM18_17445 [Methanosarcina sp.]|nr:hypothetical protein [Methanosarcina sp.]